MIYAYPTWEFAAETHMMNCSTCEIDLHTVGDLHRHTPVHELHVAFKIPYMYDYIIELCRRQAEAMQNHRTPNVCTTGQGDAIHRKYKRLKLGGGQAYDRSSV
jgi:hypothetical protein